MFRGMFSVITQEAGASARRRLPLVNKKFGSKLRFDSENAILVVIEGSGSLSIVFVDDSSHAWCHLKALILSFPTTLKTPIWHQETAKKYQIYVEKIVDMEAKKSHRPNFLYSTFFEFSFFHYTQDTQ